MTDGVVANWNKNVGEPVKRGGNSCGDETDKATSEFDLFSMGRFCISELKRARSSG